MTDFTLYYYERSGHSYKVALMLQLCNADWHGEWVNLVEGEHKSPAYLKLNEMGEVPALVDHKMGDLTLSQSGAILMHLTERLNKFGAANEQEKLEILRWILFDNHRLSNDVSQLRRLMHNGKTSDDPVVEFFRKRATQSLGVLEGHLRDHEWMVGENPTIADLSICGYLFWREEIDVDWDSIPNTNLWLERIASLPGFASAGHLMPGNQNK